MPQKPHLELAQQPWTGDRTLTVCQTVHGQGECLDQNRGSLYPWKGKGRTHLLESTVATGNKVERGFPGCSLVGKQFLSLPFQAACPEALQ